MYPEPPAGLGQATQNSDGEDAFSIWNQDIDFLFSRHSPLLVSELKDSQYHGITGIMESFSRRLSEEIVAHVISGSTLAV